MAGKLKGVIPAVTPRGTRYVRVSMSRAMLVRVSPSIRVGMEQQCSATSVEIQLMSSLHVKPIAIPRNMFYFFTNYTINRAIKY